MTFAYCLADFHNLRMSPHGRPLNPADVRDGIFELASAVHAAGLEVGYAISDLTIRFYGGWHEEGVGPTQHLRVLTAAIRSFPRRLGGRIRIQVADATVSLPHLRFTETVRPAPPPSRFRPPQIHEFCVRGHDCRANDLIRWLDGSCPEPGCRVPLTRILVRRQQKMVDTLMTADAVHLAHSGEADLLIVASDDDDLLPALLSAGASGTAVVSLFRRQPHKVRYGFLLHEAGVRIYHW